MHVIIAILCFLILLSISPTARRLLAIVVFFGVVAYVLHCNETGDGKSIPITTIAQAGSVKGLPLQSERKTENSGSVADASKAGQSTSRTKPCQFDKNQRCLNIQPKEDLEDVIDKRRSGVHIVPVLPVKKALVKHMTALNESPGPYYVDHNGSLMQVVMSENATVDITYVKPRQGLLGLVAPGMTLIHGQWNEGVLYATAYVFNNHCGPIPYPVRSEAEKGDPDKASLVLVGNAPLLDPVTCKITQWIWSDNSVIAFTPLKNN